jgi:transcriptional regulator with XRE-family HTH domain
VDGQSLGGIIRARRRELGLTQEQLAERSGGGVRQAEISRLERSAVGLSRRRRLAAIAAALGLTEGELLRQSGWSETTKRSIPALAPSAATETFSGLDLNDLRHYRDVLRQRAETSQQLLRDARRSADAAYVLLAPYGFSTRPRLLTADDQ